MTRTQDGNSTTTTTAYTHGPGIDEPLSIARDGQTYYYHADGLGSITSMTDRAQSVVNRYAYDSFGAIKASETVRNAYAFTGREYDSDTGLYYYRARYYDPEAGRFVGKDPIGFAGEDVNLYGYVGNKPSTFSDPSGLFFNSISDFYNAINDFHRNFDDMNRTLEPGGDKYFHCKANCEAARRGSGGSHTACLLSNAKELKDIYWKGHSRSDSAADQVANHHGREGGANTNLPCATVCQRYRPNSMPSWY